MNGLIQVWCVLSYYAYYSEEGVMTDMLIISCLRYCV
jgi:hypothetical protein